MFLIENAFFTTEDIRLNNLTFTWYEKIQPIFDAAQIKLLNEKEIWINKLKERRLKINFKLIEYHHQVKELRFKEKLHEAESIVQSLKNLSFDLNEISKEVKT